MHSITIDRKKKTLTITLPLFPEPRLSGTGRSHVIAETTNFVKGDAVIDGKHVQVRAIAILPLRG